jgi:5-oxoprolinase (ATP-hydrolysing) subunit B
VTVYPAPKVLTAGDRALVVELADEVDADVNRRVIALDGRIAAADIGGVVETVPTYRSLIVHYDPLRIAADDLRIQLEALAAAPDSSGAEGRLWRVPVVYGGAFGLDLGDVAARHGMTEAELIASHASVDYRVYMIGFVPGYTYLGGFIRRAAPIRAP